jgi:hypothetical protein
MKLPRRQFLRLTAGPDAGPFSSSAGVAPRRWRVSPGFEFPLTLLARAAEVIT